MKEGATTSYDRQSNDSQCTRAKNARHVVEKEFLRHLFRRDDDDADADTCTKEMKQLQGIQGIVFGKSIRSHYAILHVAVQKNSNDGAPFKEHDYAVVRVEFLDDSVDITDQRSWCRRCCKLGDLVVFEGEWIEETDKQTFAVKIDSFSNANDVMSVTHVRYWSMPKCQEWQHQYRPKVVVVDKEEKRNVPKKKRVKIENNSGEQDKTLRHGGNKRDQGECVADFIIHIMMLSLEKRNSGSESTIINDWANGTFSSKSLELRDEAIEALNKGTGVLDAAGGSGYVSMALGMKGVKSTVVDARESVGRLPKRDRKVWNRLLIGVSKKNGNDNNVVLCQPVVPYDSLRAWFAKPPPENVDTSFRHGDVESIPVCGEQHELLRNCSALVALHPDEATDAFVDLAVKRRVPFVVVPCCVFSRFFGYRRKPGTDLPVTTYEDLLDYLCEKDKSIQRTTLPFEGANVALWSVF